MINTYANPFRGHRPKRLRQCQSRNGIPGLGLRSGVRGGSCPSARRRFRQRMPEVPGTPTRSTVAKK